LGTYLVERGIRVENANDDADVLIVETVIKQADTSTSFVIGEDTELFSSSLLSCKERRDEHFLQVR
jgi:hypothetical protein